jgi:hypothetical protein
MSDETQQELDHLISLLQTQKSNLRALEKQRAIQSDMYQILPLINALAAVQTELHRLEWEIALLTLVPLFEKINVHALLQLYLASFDTTKPLGDLLIPPDQASPMLIFKTLLTEVPDRTVFRRFLGLIIQRYGDLKPSLWAELQRVGTHLGVSLKDIGATSGTPQEATSETALLVALEPHKQHPDQYHVQAWLWFGPGMIEQLANDDRKFYSLDELKPTILTLYTQAIAHKRVNAAQLTLEFFLPISLLSEPLHSWDIELDGDIPSDLGYEHQVNVRLFDRTLRPTSGEEYAKAKRGRDIWKQKWENLSRASMAQVLKLRTAEELDDKRALYKSIKDSVCYIETCLVHRSHTSRVTLSAAGIPVGIWLSCGIACSDTELAQFVSFIDTLVLDFSVPKNIHLIRQHEPWAQSIILLWDDPSRRPYDIDDPDDPNNPSFISM